MFSTFCSRISKPKTVDNAELSFLPVRRAVVTQTHYFFVSRSKEAILTEGWEMKSVWLHTELDISYKRLNSFF